nr:hypothetical protein [Profundibacterium mesophilum]
MLAPFLLALALIGVAAAARAECYADYKAKTDDPLRLHYGVIALPEEACTPEAAPRLIAERIDGEGWTLLKVMAIFDADGLEERRTSAGDYFLRY